jgi:hypothetical protein
MFACLFVERFRGEIDTAGPGDGSRFGIDGDLGEVRGVVQRCQDASPALGGEVHVARGAVAEQQAQHVIADHGYACNYRQVRLAHMTILRQRCYGEQGLAAAGSFPVCQQLGSVEPGPVPNESEGSRFEGSGEHDAVDGD